MALFTLSDIKFTTPKQQSRTSSNLAGGSNGWQYENNIFRYPLDIGNYDKGHYVLIHINEQVHTQYANQYAIGDDPTIIANRKKYNTPTTSTNTNAIVEAGSEVISNEIKEKISSGINQLGVAGEGIKSVGDVFGSLLSNASSVNGIRTIRRTTDTVALYMPDTLAFTHQQSYSDMALGGGLPAAALAAGASAVETLKSGQSSADMAKAFAKNLTPYLASSVLNKLGPTGQYLFAAGAGMVQNPMLELLYSSPSFRTFRLDFVLYPRSQKEAREVMRLINRLKFHQAPEIRREFNGFFLVPPSEFDITFMYNGAANPNLPEISTCVLEQIDVDYAPNGFSAYEVPGKITADVGETGTPVAIRLGLQFKETEIMTKDNFATNRAAGASSASRSVEEEAYSKSLGDFAG